MIVRKRWQWTSTLTCVYARHKCALSSRRGCALCYIHIYDVGVGGPLASVLAIMGSLIPTVHKDVKGVRAPASISFKDRELLRNQSELTISLLWGWARVGWRKPFLLLMDKYALAKKIEQLEGLTNEEKSELLRLIRTKKKYGLVWEDKPEDVECKLKDHLPVVEEVKERAIVSDDADAPNHILIEGDNLEALTALSYTHAGKIDVIYIDPPYNTGNKDFSYNDSFVDKEDGYRHSKWLSFMNKRLRIAKQLLSDKGVIFISIDDNEQAQLKLLCDELFGVKNCLATVVQKSRDSISGDLLFSPNHNYLLVYAKHQEIIFANRDSFRIPIEVDEKKFKNPDNDPRGPWKLNPVDGPGGERKGNPYYTFLGISGYYRYSKEMMQHYYDDGLIVKRKTSLGKKYFLSQAKQKKGVPPTTWWEDAGKTANGTKLLQKILPEITFNNPKPLELIVRCLQLMDSNSLILDFFAGSGTTLHATMQLNAEDGGHRQCILATNNENGICENVTYERNRRVIQGYTTPKGVAVAGLSHNNLRYYKTKLLPRRQSIKNKRALVNVSTDLLCIKNDVYTEQTCFAGRRLKTSCARYFDDGKTKMLVIYNELTVDAFAQTISQMEVEGKILIYVFSNTRYAFDDNFEEVLDRVELCALPAAIYDAYRNILPEEKPEFEEPLVAADTATDDAEGEARKGQLSFDFPNE